MPGAEEPCLFGRDACCPRCPLCPLLSTSGLPAWPPWTAGLSVSTPLCWRARGSSSGTEWSCSVQRGWQPCPAQPAVAPWLPGRLRVGAATRLSDGWTTCFQRARWKWEHVSSISSAVLRKVVGCSGMTCSVVWTLPHLSTIMLGVLLPCCQKYWSVGLRPEEWDGQASCTYKDSWRVSLLPLQPCYHGF